MLKRCKFCARKLNENALCENVNCPENLRREIVEKSTSEKVKNAAKP